MSKFDLQSAIDNLPAGLDRAILRVLSFHVGKENAISRQELMKALAMHGFDFWTGEVDLETGEKIYGNDRPVRLQINQLRKDGRAICSAGGVGGGYYLPENWGELQEYINREIRSRAMDLLEQEKALKDAGERMWGKYSPAKQTSLF